MGQAWKTLITPWRLVAVVSVGAWSASAAAQPAPAPPAFAPVPAASDSAAPPPAGSTAPPPAASAAPGSPPAPAPAATAPPPPPGYTPPAYVGPYAQPGYPPPSMEPPLPPEPPPDNRTVSLTLSPVHLLIGPIVEIEGEYRVAQHVGFALIGGYGEVKVDQTDINGNKTTTSFTTFEIGSQLNIYPSKPFKGLDLGAELMYLKINTDSVADTQFSGIGVGLAVGPLIGYKVMTDGGFTFVIQGGVSYLAVKAEVKDPSGASSSQNDSSFLPNLNLNLGWSF